MLQQDMRPILEVLMIERKDSQDSNGPYAVDRFSMAASANDPSPSAMSLASCRLHGSSR